MFARLTYIRFLPEHEERVRKIFKEEIVPEVKKQKGLIDIKWLEPTDKSEDYISMTEWDRKEDADAYASSGTYQRLVDKLKDLYTKKPSLKTFNYETATVLTSIR